MDFIMHLYEPLLIPRATLSNIAEKEGANRLTLQVLISSNYPHPLMFYKAVHSFLVRRRLCIKGRVDCLRTGTEGTNCNEYLY